MSKAIANLLAAAVFLAVGSLNQAAAQDAGFDIARYQVEGNTILSAETVQALVAPFVGKGKVYGDVQKALEALEGEFRRLGYGTVQVYVPEQELTTGVVRLVVSEGTVKNHVSSILSRLGLRDRTQAALYAHEHHLIDN